jgi:hypothetical protein
VFRHGRGLVPAIHGLLAKVKDVDARHKAGHDEKCERLFPQNAPDGLESICIPVHNQPVPWTVVFHPEFEPEFDRMDPRVREELLAQAHVLEAFAPRLGRPRVDTLKDSDHANMKELRFAAAGGVWRVAFAFDPRQQAILVVAGAKQGVSQERFYRQLIRKADERFSRHLARLDERKKR